MSLPLIPPKTEPLIDDNRFPTLFWQIFFENVATGDSGTTWQPNFVGLSATGTPTITGVYYKISAALVFYRIKIVPATNTSSVAGTTYCDNFPLTFGNDSPNLAVSGFTAAAAGTQAAPSRIYTAAWTNLTTPISIIGIAETT